MHGLLVVDDEVSIREGIAKAIPWEAHGIRVVGQAADGIEALELCEALGPDVVITDVMMDQMSGLDLAEALRSRMPSTRVIIISGHDDFELVRRAVELKVVSYVLKPIDPAALLAKVEQTVRELEEDRRVAERIAALGEHVRAHREVLLNRFTGGLVDGRPDTEEEIRRLAAPLDVRFRSRRYLVAALRVDQPGTESSALAVLEAAREIVGGTWECLGSLCEEDEVVLIVGNTCADASHYHDPQKIQDRERVAEAVERVVAAARANLGLDVSAGIGKWHPFPQAFARSGREARACLDRRICAGPGCVIRFEDIAAVRSDVFLYPFEQERRILRVFDMDAGPGAVDREVEAFFRDLEEQGCLLSQARGAAFQLLAVLTRSLMERGSLEEPLEAMRRAQERVAAFSSYGEFVSFFTTLTREALARGEEQRRTGVKAVIRLAQEYVLQNFASPLLSQTSIAEHLHVSPSYFSALYKKETGETYVEFVTRVRVEEAKQRLRGTNARVQDVGSSVGYLNAQYFCTLFRKSTGMSPAEYRNARA